MPQVTEVAEFELDGIQQSTGFTASSTNLSSNTDEQRCAQQYGLSSVWRGPARQWSGTPCRKKLQY